MKNNLTFLGTFLFASFLIISCGGGNSKDSTSGKDSATTSENPQEEKATVLAIGQDYQGGKIAYILQANDLGYDSKVQHGIIAAPSDQSAKAKWYTKDGAPPIKAHGFDVGTGQENTAIILKAYGAEGVAAKICDDLVLGEYSDWYLPSKDELNKLYISRHVIGGFSNDVYWSSTEESGSYAWRQDFGSGVKKDSGKLNPFCVRAIRTF